MTLQAKCGFLNTTTNAAGNTVVVNDVGFQPKVVLFWVTGRTDTTDARGRANHKGGFGYAISTSDRRFIASLAQDTPTTMVTNAMQGNAQCFGVTTTADAVDGLMDLQSMDSGGFTLVIDDAFTASYTVMYLALGGSDIVDVFGGNFTKNTTTGNQSVNSLTAKPNFIIFFTTGQTTINNTVAVDSQLCIGAAKSSSNRYVVSGVSDDGIGTSRARSYCIDSEVIALSASTPNSGLEDRGDFVDFHSSPSNGFTINWTESAATGKVINYIAFNLTDAAMVSLGDLLTQTDTSTDIVESNGFVPIGGMFFSHMLGKSTADTYQNDHLLSIGAFNSTSSRLVGAIADNDAAGTAVVSTGDEFDEVYFNLDPTGTITGLMDIKSVDNDGFTAIMDDADPSQAFVWYFTFGLPHQSITASVGALAIAGRQATVTPGAVTITATVGALSIAGRQGSVSTTGGGQTVQATVGALTIAGRQATVTPGAVTVQASVGALTIAGRQAALVPGAVTITASVGALAIAGRQASIVAGGVTIQAVVGTLVIAGRQASIIAGAVTVSANVGALVIAGRQASISTSGGSQTITANVGTLVMSGHQANIPFGTGVPALLFPPLLIDATNPQLEAWPMDTLTVDTFITTMPVSASNVQLEAKALNEKMTV